MKFRHRSSNRIIFFTKSNSCKFTAYTVVIVLHCCCFWQDICSLFCSYQVLWVSLNIFLVYIKIILKVVKTSLWYAQLFPKSYYNNSKNITLTLRVWQYAWNWQAVLRTLFLSDLCLNNTVNRFPQKWTNTFGFHGILSHFIKVQFKLLFWKKK